MIAVRAVNLLMAAMMAGGLTLVLVAVIPTFRRLPDQLAIRLHRAVDRYVDVPLPIFTVLTIVSSVPLLFEHGQPGLAVPLVAVAAGGAIAVALGSHLINRPMNLELRSWGEGSVPIEYAQLRRRWDAAHALRTGAGLVTLICLIVAMLETSTSVAS